ncbi:phage tail protein [Mesorhizobium sp. ZC-5]|uniref:phage tail protein n=1 Tax=Mesorhizobium sp. ZC-5 TaxID=2986066 RepID=UPI0021E850B2|nr:phage tail protein [Mesorhizobium sp. ZC-5]MCV3240029.1 phage tail protein [Mesorhizobium sp. ZC-5]
MHGYVVSDPASARAALEPVIDLFGIAVCEIGGGLSFRREIAGNMPSAAVTELVVEGRQPVIEISRVPDHQLPTEAILGFRDPFADYQAGSARKLRQGTSAHRQETIGFPGVLEAGEAAALLDDWMRRTWSRRESVSFAVPAPEAGVEPGAIIRLPAIGASEFLVTEIEDGLTRKVSARQVSRSAPVPADGRLPVVNPPPLTIAGRPLSLFLDLPMAPGASQPHQQFRVAVWNRAWRSQMVFASPEDSGFVQRASVGVAATIGRLVDPLGAGFEGRIDRTGTITVKLFDGELASVSQLQLLNGANVAAIRSAIGVWELVQFETVEEYAPGEWSLTGLLRRQLGTTDAMAAGAAAGADFVLIDEAVRAAGLLPGECGLAMNWRVGRAGHDFSAANFVQRTETGGIRSSLPLAPAHLRGRLSAAGDLAIEWKRRGRIDADSWQGLDIPLGEETETYRIEIATVDGIPVRTATAATPHWIYAAAQIAADLSPIPPEIDVAVSQLSATAGWGLPARRRLSLV